MFSFVLLVIFVQFSRKMCYCLLLLSLLVICLFTQLIETESEPQSCLKIIHWPLYHIQLPLRVAVNVETSEMEHPKMYIRLNWHPHSSPELEETSPMLWKALCPLSPALNWNIISLTMSSNVCLVYYFCQSSLKYHRYMYPLFP